MVSRLSIFAWGSGLLLCMMLQTSALAQETASKEIAWFDMDHCEICKNMAFLKSDMHRVECDIHMLDDGMLMISVVPKNLKEKMAKAEKGIEETVKQLEAGKQLPLCGFCNTYGGLMGTGAKFTNLKTAGGDITMITSTDPEVVKEIQAFGKRSIEENKRFQKELKAAAGVGQKKKKNAAQ